MDLIFNKRISIVFLFILLIAMSCNNSQKNSSTDSINKDTAEQLKTLLETDRKAFLSQLTTGLESDFEKAQSIINWLAVNFDWKATDYKKRNVQQIINRGGGNCNDLAMVAINLMDSAHINIRKVREINIHINNEQRQNTAESLVSEKGFKYSVFGKMHNDHVWIEIHDQKKQNWVPADPSLGLVGLDNWMKGRVTFGERKTLDPGSEDMIVPIAIFAQDKNGDFAINRTEYYLIESFDKIYNNKLSQNPSWDEWSKHIKSIDDKCLAAFEGKENLHNHQAEIEVLYNIYMNLKLDLQKAQ